MSFTLRAQRLSANGSKALPAKPDSETSSMRASKSVCSHAQLQGKPFGHCDGTGLLNGLGVFTAHTHRQQQFVIGQDRPHRRNRYGGSSLEIKVQIKQDCCLSCRVRSAIPQTQDERNRTKTMTPMAVMVDIDDVIAVQNA